MKKGWLIVWKIRYLGINILVKKKKKDMQLSLTTVLFVSA